jgi:hypothetical protein
LISQTNLKYAVIIIIRLEYIQYIGDKLCLLSKQRNYNSQFRLSDNSNTQRQLNEAAFHAEMDLKAKQIEQKLEVGEIDIIHLIIHVISVQCDLSQVSAVIIHSSCKFR